MTIEKDLFMDLPVDKVCSCGEHLQFKVNERTGKLAPICIEHNINHFLDCPNRERYKKQVKHIQNRLGLE